MACSGESNQEVGHALMAAMPEACQNNQFNTADPVNVVTGAFLHTEQDVAFPCQRLILALKRHYNNQLHKPCPNERMQGFGPGWSHSLGVRIEKGDETVTYVDDCGARIEFRNDPAKSTFVAPPGSLGMRLSYREHGGFQLRQVSGLSAEFDADGRVETLFQPGIRKDSRLIFEYDELGRLISVQGGSARGLDFRYDPDDYFIRKVTDHSGRQWCYYYNGHRELVEVKGPGGRSRRYEYGNWEGRIAVERKASKVESLRALSRVFSFVSSDQASLSFAEVTNCYTTEQRVHIQLDALGNPTRFEYNPFTKTTGVTDPAGYTTLYCFDEAGSTTRVRRPSGSTIEYVFDDRRNLLAEIDPMGQRIEYADLKDASKLSSQLEFGRRTIGNRSGYLDFTPADIELGYDADGNPPLRRDALGQTTVFEGYTSFGKPEKIVLPNGSTVITEYEKRSGLPLRQTKQLRMGRVEPLHLVEEWTYDDFGNCVQHKTWAETESAQAVSPTRVECFDFDEQSQHVVNARTWIETSMEGESLVSENRFEWDSLGRLIRETSLRRISPEIELVYLTKHFVYDVLDRLVGEVLPDGTAKCWEYDLDGHILETFIVLDAHPDLLQKVPPNERLQWNRWEYDAMGREIKHFDPAGLVTTREWDSRGLCTAIIDSSGARTEFSYDRDSNLDRECTNRGYEIKLNYDAAGRVVSRRDSLGSEVYQERDALGRTLRIVQGDETNSPATCYTYDALGRLAQVRLPDDTFEALSYDEFSNLIRKERGRLGDEPLYVEVFNYDGLGRLLTAHAGAPSRLVQQFRFEYADVRREVKTFDALDNVSHSVYDSEGNLVARIDAEGRKLQFAYNRLGRLTRRWSDDGLVDSSFTYELGNLHSSAVEGAIRYEWEYDQAGRLVRNVQTVSGESKCIEYRYDNSGRMVSKLMDDRWWMRYAYDSSFFLPSRIELPNNTIQLEYDAGGRLVEERWQDGGRSSYQYSGGGSLSRLERWDSAGTSVLSQSFEHDSRKRPTREIRCVGSTAVTYLYHYDALNRLTKIENIEESTPSLFREYVYDDLGNRLAESRIGTPHSTYNYDIANRLISASQSDGSSQTLQYDRCGNLVSGISRIFDYDAAQRLRSVFDSTHRELVTAYHHAATDEPALIDHPGRTEKVFYDGQQEIVFEDENEVGLAFWGAKLDFLLATAEHGLGPSRAYTDSLSSFVRNDSQPGPCEYDQFGNTLVGDDFSRFGFCSKRRDKAAGLYYNRARFYDSASGRFTQPDPSGFVDGLNPYVFVRNNPLNYIDKTGYKSRQVSQGRIADIAPALAFFPGQKDGRSYAVGPGWLESRGHVTHYDANSNLLGRSYVVDPGWLEYPSNYHVEHFDANRNLVGRTYVEEPGIIESFVDPTSRFQHYGSNWEKTGRTYVEGPGIIESFVDPRSYFQHYGSNWEKTGRTYVEGPGIIESFVDPRPHFRHYA
jgi:RHS repeat-associated protein